MSHGYVYVAINLVSGEVDWMWSPRELRWVPRPSAPEHAAADVVDLKDYREKRQLQEV